MLRYCILLSIHKPVHLAFESIAEEIRGEVPEFQCFNSPDEPQHERDKSNVCGPQQVQEAQGLNLLACCLFNLRRDRNYSRMASEGGTRLRLEVLTLDDRKMTCGGSTRFSRAADLSRSSASCKRPRDTNQRGDSGISLIDRQTQNTKCIICHSLVEYFLVENM